MTRYKQLRSRVVVLAGVWRQKGKWLASYLRWKVLLGKERRRAKRCRECQHSNTWAIDGICYFPFDAQDQEYCFCQAQHHATTRESRGGEYDAYYRNHKSVHRS